MIRRAWRPWGSLNFVRSMHVLLRIATLFFFFCFTKPLLKLCRKPETSGSGKLPAMASLHGVLQRPCSRTGGLIEGVDMGPKGGEAVRKHGINGSTWHLVHVYFHCSATFVPLTEFWGPSAIRRVAFWTSGLLPCSRPGPVTGPFGVESPGLPVAKSAAGLRLARRSRRCCENFT